MPDLPTIAPAGDRLERPSHRDPEQWARGVEGPVELGEADARIVLDDKRLRRAVRQATKKLETTGKQAPRAASRERGGALGEPPRSSAPAVPSARARLRAALRELRHAGLFLVLFIPVLPMLFPPGIRYGGVSEQASLRFFEVNFASYLLVCAIQLSLLGAWVLNPQRWQWTRLLSAAITLLMLAAVPWWMLLGAIEVPPRTWAPQLIPFGLAMPLAAANLWAWNSERGRRAELEEKIRQMRAMLRANPDLAGTGSGPRGPVRELQHVTRRWSEQDQQTLERRRARVLDILEARGLITPQITGRAAELPLGRWHELDD